MGFIDFGGKYNAKYSEKQQKNEKNDFNHENFLYSSRFQHEKEIFFVILHPKDINNKHNKD